MNKRRQKQVMFGLSEEEAKQFQRILAGKLYRLLDKETCFSDICGESDFEEYFERVLDDCELVLKNH